MPQLATFRKGWESENLAQYILYKFSFLARPTNVADDIGSDFFCTLFQIQKTRKHDFLIPKNSFAIQLKSNSDNIDVSDKVQFLNTLEIPFFVGVVNREELSLDIYSGEYIPFLFSHFGIPENLEIQLCERAAIHQYEDSFRKTGTKSYVLMFPHVAEVKADISPHELEQKVREISNVCLLMQTNIASKTNGEYIFRQYGFGPENVIVFAGSGSAKVFRQNFFARLTEVFSNLDWLRHSVPSEFDEIEFAMYSDIYTQLKGMYKELPLPLTRLFERLNSNIERKK